MMAQEPGQSSAAFRARNETLMISPNTYFQMANEP